MTKTEYEKLKAQLEEADELYRAGETTGLSDTEFDSLRRKLKSAEEDHPEWGSSSVTSKVGSDLTPGFKRYKHEAPMLSIEDVFEKKTDDPEQYDFSEAFSWIVALSKQLTGADSSAMTVSVEHKLDGCAMCLVYKDGNLEVAATRGDGKEGDDITNNAKLMSGVPHKIDIPGTVTVIGEAIMPRSAFEDINEKQRAAGEKEFANPRNLTAGTIKSHDPALVDERGIHFIAHGLRGYTVDGANPYETLYSFCTKAGIECVCGVTLMAYDLPQILQTLKLYKDGRDTYGYDIDGAVIKINSASTRESLGCTARAPRWACAMKFLPEQKVTKVRRIALQVGRTGNITPVAILDPVKLSGSTVSRATLHNQDEINRLGVNFHSSVVVEKSGDIIPAVVKVVDEVKVKPFDIMKSVQGVCPYCGHPLTKEEGQVAIKCLNPFCEGKLIETVVYMCSRAVFDISGIGDAAVRALVREGLINSPLDLFTLTKDQLAALNLSASDQTYTFGEKMAEKALAAIAKARTAPFSKWLMAANISGVGKTKAEALAKRFDGFDDLMTAGKDIIVNQVGNAVTQSIVAWFSSTDTDEHFLSRLPGLGVTPTSERETTDKKLMSDKLAGKTVVITGTLSQHRSVFEKMVVENGGICGKSVSGNTSMLLVGEKAGSKLRKAEQLGIAIITEDEFLAMINK